MRHRRIEVTPMMHSDLDEVMEVERHAYRSPWTRQIFVEELDREWAHLDVVRDRDASGQSRVVGFANYWLVRDEVHLLNIAVAPELRRRGYAKCLMDHLLDFSRRHQCRYVTLEVRRSNRAAIELYKRYGFEPVGVRPKYYVEDGEDAVVMLLSLS